MRWAGSGRIHITVACQLKGAIFDSVDGLSNVVTLVASSLSFMEKIDDTKPYCIRYSDYKLGFARHVSAHMMLVERERHWQNVVTQSTSCQVEAFALPRFSLLRI